MTTPLTPADLEIQYLEKGLATLTALITRGTERGDDVHLVEIQAQTIRDRLAQLRGAEPALQPEPGRVPPPDETPTHYDLEDPTRYDPAVHRKFVLIVSLRSSPHAAAAGSRTHQRLRARCQHLRVT